MPNHLKYASLYRAMPGSSFAWFGPASRWIAARWPGPLTVLLLLYSMLCEGCTPWRSHAAKQPSITVTRIPQADATGGPQTEIIAGTTSGAEPGDRIALYAWAGAWWIQPLEAQPWTNLDRAGKWINGTHTGTRYAALLVAPGFHPLPRLDTLPELGSTTIKAKVVVAGAAEPPSPILSFSGYRWRCRNTASDRGGTMNRYSPANEWTDGNGRLHLAITGAPDRWLCAEVTLAQNFGYGTYSFDLSDASSLESSTVFAFFLYDYAAGDANHREANIEISRWGNDSIKDGQYVVQPFHVASNVSRFLLERGPTRHFLDWEPGRMTFRSTTLDGHVMAQHVFTSGVPRPGLESPRMAFYVYNHGIHKQTKTAEVMMTNFRFLP